MKTKVSTTTSSSSSRASSATTPSRRLLLLRVILVVLLAILSPTATRAQTQQTCPTRCRSCSNRQVDCTSMSLTAPPRNYPSGTAVIDLGHNHVRLLGSRTFRRLASVEILKINENKITVLRGNAFRSFPNVATLDLSQNRIFRILDTAFRGLGSLRTLLLNRNRISTLQNTLQGLPNLYQLNLARNRIRSIGETDLAGLTRLGSLDLRNNQISRIHPQAFNNVNRLRYLFMKNNPIGRRLPELRFGSQVLQLVDMSRCRMQSVPKTLPSSLSDFRLSNNRILQVNATDFTNITDLQLLALNDNRLNFFADGSLTHLQELQEVWLRRNELVYIPRHLPDNLRRLDMDSNSIQQIEAGLFSADSRLESLNVAHNQIADVQPNTFLGMSRLHHLDFQGNHLQRLRAESFKDLASLRTLMLSNNPLQRIENAAFQNLANLTRLYMSYVSQDDFQLDYNFLTEMPALTHVEVMASPALAEALVEMLHSLTPSQTFSLPDVTTVDLSYNTLEYLSPKIRTVFPGLRNLPLDGNPFRCTRRLQWLQGWIMSTQIHFSKAEDPRCESPPQLYGRSIVSLAEHEWGDDDADRSQETWNARAVSERMARDMADVQDSARSSQHVEEDTSGYHRRGSHQGSVTEAAGADERSSLTRKSDARSSRKRNLLQERTHREERRRQKLRSKGGRRRVKGKKKNRKRGGERKGKGRKGKGRKGRKGRKGSRRKNKDKQKREKRQKRDADHIGFSLEE